MVSILERKPRPEHSFKVLRSVSWALLSGELSLLPLLGVSGPSLRGVCTSASSFPVQLLCGTIKSHW